MKKEGLDFSKLVVLKKNYDAYMSKALYDENISVGHLVFLKALSTKDFNSQQELSKFISCNKAHTSRIVTKLQENGLIQVDNSKNSHIAINLTEKGKEYAKKADKLANEYISKIIENIDPDELKTFKKVFNQIYENAEKIIDE